MELHDSHSGQTDAQRKTGRPTPVWLKRILLTLFFTASLGGMGYGVTILFRSVRTAAESIPALSPLNEAEQAEPESIKSPKKPFLGLKKKPSTAVVFQGSATGKDGKMLALISGETVGVNAKLHGVKVLKISRQSVLLEFNGQEYLLQPGERLKP